MRVRFLHPLSGFPAHERIPLEEVLPHILEIRSLAQSAGAPGHQLGRGRFTHSDIFVQCNKWCVDIHQTHARDQGKPTTAISTMPANTPRELPRWLLKLKSALIERPDNASESSPSLYVSFAQALYLMRASAEEGAAKWV